MKTKSLMPNLGFENYEEQLNAIKPNNQFNYQATKPQQIYRDYRREMMNYPHMIAAEEEKARKEAENYSLATNQNDLLAFAQNQQQGKSQPFNKAQAEKLQQQIAAQQAINQGEQNQWNKGEQQKAWQQQMQQYIPPKPVQQVQQSVTDQIAAQIALIKSGQYQVDNPNTWLGTTDPTERARRYTERVNRLRIQDSNARAKLQELGYTGFGMSNGIPKSRGW